MSRVELFASTEFGVNGLHRIFLACEQRAVPPPGSTMTRECRGLTQFTGGGSHSMFMYVIGAGIDHLAGP